MAIRLNYVGENPRSQWIAGVPASDHEVEDAGWAAELVASGLYAYDGEEPADSAIAGGPAEMKQDEPSPSEDGA